MGIVSTEGNGEGRPGDGDPPEPSHGERRLERGREKRGEVNGYGGEETSPCPRLNPMFSSPSGSTVLGGGSTAHER